MNGNEEGVTKRAGGVKEWEKQFMHDEKRGR